MSQRDLNSFMWQRESLTNRPHIKGAAFTTGTLDPLVEKMDEFLGTGREEFTYLSMAGTIFAVSGPMHPVVIPTWAYGATTWNTFSQRTLPS